MVKGICGLSLRHLFGIILLLLLLVFEDISLDNVSLGEGLALLSMEFATAGHYSSFLDLVKELFLMLIVEGY